MDRLQGVELTRLITANHTMRVSGTGGLGCSASKDEGTALVSRRGGVGLSGSKGCAGGRVRHRAGQASILPRVSLRRTVRGGNFKGERMRAAFVSKRGETESATLPLSFGYGRLSLSLRVGILSVRQPLGRDRVTHQRRCYHDDGGRIKEPVCVMEPLQMRKESIGSDQEVAFTNGLGLSNSLEELSTRPSWKIVPDIWETTARIHGDNVALLDPHFDPPTELTFKELEQLILDFGEGMQVLGMTKGETVSLFSENSHRWLIADQGSMVAGLIDAVRGGNAPPKELFHILSHSDSSAIILQDEQLLEKLLPFFDGKNSVVRFCVLLQGSVGSDVRRKTPFDIHTYADLVAAGSASRQTRAATNGIEGRPEHEAIRSDDVATLVYTSGTTGIPKGVMLTHHNLLHQVRNLNAVVLPQAKGTLLSILPPWHMYERSAEYFFMSHGGRLVYSNVQSFREDLTRYPPDYFVAVPLVFDVLYNGVQKRLASSSAARKKIAEFLIHVSKRYCQAQRVWKGLAVVAAQRAYNSMHSFGEWLVAGIVMTMLLPLHLLAHRLVHQKIRSALGIRTVAVSGGGSLSPHVDEFFEAIGLPLVNGYGLTETSPVLAARRIHANALGTVGPPIDLTELKIVDTVTGANLPDGCKGQVKARGPQIMKGYYKNPAETIAIMDEDGWFNTGDLGWIAPRTKTLAGRNCGGMLVLEGRVKDTIVLSNGENVEPSPLEEALLQSDLISQVMLVGQDRRRVGALIVPVKDELHAKALSVKARRGDNSPPTEDDYKELIRQELRERINLSKGFRSHESVGLFVLLDEAFSVDNGMLTATMKMRRDVITEKYAEKISSLFRET